MRRLDPLQLQLGVYLGLLTWQATTIATAPDPAIPAALAALFAVSAVVAAIAICRRPAPAAVEIHRDGDTAVVDCLGCGDHLETVGVGDYERLKAAQGAHRCGGGSK